MATEASIPLFGRLGEKVLETVVGMIADAKRDPTEEEIGGTIKELIPQIIQAYSERISDRQKAQIKAVEREFDGFSRRNQKRWKAAFDALESLWQICAEIGGEFNEYYRPGAVEREDFTFEALTSLHARSLLVAREALTLMRHGYAEGALARWRTLHELTCTALLIKNSGQDIALRYLASFRFQAYWAATQANSTLDLKSTDRFSDEELDAMRAECIRLEAEFGSNLKKDYEWARPVLGCLPSKKPVTFRDIEGAAEQTAIRPYYQWASQHNHSGYRPNDKGLGLVETTNSLLLIGPSDAGMTEPLQLVALNLAKMSVALLTSKPSIDVAIYLGVIEHFSRIVAPIAFDVERKTREAAQRKKPPKD